MEHKIVRERSTEYLICAGESAKFHQEPKGHWLRITVPKTRQYCILE